jgi:hypothetical protein
MSFLRHARSIGPMWANSLRVKAGDLLLPPVGRPRVGYKGANEIAPLLIVRDESHRLSLGGLVSTRAPLRFAGCVQFAMKEYGRSRNFQRTANSVLTANMGLRPAKLHENESELRTIERYRSGEVGQTVEKSRLFNCLIRSVRN